MDMDAEGQELWRVALDAGAEVASPPALTDSHAYIASVDGALFVLSTAPEGSTPAEGRILERHKLEGASGDGLSLLISAPVVGNGRLWVSGDTAGLVCMQSGEER
jgi:outer membrane protein assembly factor BamB